MSQYLFGYQLDGCFAPSQWQGLGKSVCGPSSFLSALETCLGLPPIESSNLKREIAYRNALLETCAQQDTSNHHFYSKSFEHDPMATARLILSWRDQLMEAGWSASLDHDQAPHRLKTLSLIDQAFHQSDYAEACPAGRIKAILKEINLVDGPIIEELVVIDPRESLPQCWINLLEALDAQFQLPSFDAPVTSSPYLLAELQSKLTHTEKQQQTSQTSHHDDSVRIITAANPEVAAKALAIQMASLPMPKTTLIATPNEQAKLNPYLEQQDVARPQAKEEAGVALLQLPALFLNTRFAPVNPQSYLEFLLHSICPVPKQLRNSLAYTINNTPGYGEHWEKSLDLLISKKTDQLEEEQKKETAAELRQSYEQWIAPVELNPDHLSGPQIAELLTPLSQWISKRAGAIMASQEEDSTTWLSASRAINELISIFSTEGLLTRIEIERLLSDWLKTSRIKTQYQGELGASHSVTSPAQLLEQNDHIIWWNPTSITPKRSPWSEEETTWLEHSNIQMIDEHQRSLAIEQVALNTVMMAKKSLTIYHITQSEGKSTHQPGILTRIEAYCGDNIISTARENITTERIVTRPLPSKRRWWKFNQTDLFSARKTESFSSVSKVIDTPFIWVLDYHARLKPAPIFSYGVKDSPLRTGSVLHALAEALFDSNAEIDWRTISEAEFHSEIETTLSDLFRSSAAHYLTPGNESARANLIHDAKQTFWSLCQILNQAEITQITMEKSIPPIPFIGGEIAGRIDLIASRANGKTAVIDLKLGGKGKRQAELATNRHLQLAIYGQLMLVTENIGVATAFYILSNGGTLLTRNEVFFPDTQAVSPKKDTPHGDWQECWAEFQEVYQWRRNQLDRGKVEVPVPGTDADPNEAPPWSRWESPKESCQYSPYDALTGWSPNA